MLSRVADSLYWMSRYLERTENTVRQLDVTLGLVPDAGSEQAEEQWHRLVASLGKPEGLEWSGNLEHMAHRLIFDGQVASSVTSCIDSARENARQVREEISSEQWQRVNRIYHQIHSAEAELQFHEGINDLLASIVDSIHLFIGVSASTMIHGQGWNFIRLARYLERAYATATLLEVYQPILFHPGDQDLSGALHSEQVGLLRCCTSFEAYCQVYTAKLSPARILEFMLLNSNFPHAIRYCVDGMREAIDSIQSMGGRPVPSELVAGIGRLHAMLDFTSIGEILSGDATFFLRSIREQCLRIHELIYRNYVNYSIQSALAV
jgi:uncharacterized alpha-E superfamily protein